MKAILLFLFELISISFSLSQIIQRKASDLELQTGEMLPSLHPKQMSSICLTVAVQMQTFMLLPIFQ